MRFEENAGSPVEAEIRRKRGSGDPLKAKFDDPLEARCGGLLKARPGGEKMGEMITAVYERGALHPLTPLKLREHQRVRIQVVTEDASEEEDEREREQVLNILAAAGLVQPKPKGPIPPDPVSAGERQRLAELLGSAPGKPLSEIVIEDRGEW